MPEIAEVRVVANTLKRQILNKKIRNIKILYSGIIIGNEDNFKKLIVGQTFKDITTFGKWILFNLGEYTLISHLRMEGKYFYVNSGTSIQKHEHVIFELDDGMDLRYADVRKFGKMKIVKTEHILTTDELKKLGKEPDDVSLTPEYLIEKFRKCNKNIKTALLDQTIINGLGNIYANEVLFATHILPSHKANEITLNQAAEIIKASSSIIKTSYEMGGCTIRSYTSSLGVIGHYQDMLKVHMQVTCPNCKSKIKKIKIDGRSTYYCEICQK